jgi:hypothetical protein
MVLNRWMLSRPMPKGFPTLRTLTPPATDDAEAVAAFAASCDRFATRLAEGGPFAIEPFLGPLPPSTWRTIHLMHATHHLSFLNAAER